MGVFSRLVAAIQRTNFLRINLKKEVFLKKKKDKKPHQNTTLATNQSPPLLLLGHCDGARSRYMTLFFIINRVVASLGAGFALPRALSLGRVAETSLNLQNNKKPHVWLQG